MRFGVIVPVSYQTRKAPMPKPAQHPSPLHTLQQGFRAKASDADTFAFAIDAAIDYRGDITLLLKSSESIEGFLYDRKQSPAAVRIMPKDGSGRRTIALADIAAIEISGKDTASGKSFETWMKKYVAKKLAGERAAIESEVLD